MSYLAVSEDDAGLIDRKANAEKGKEFAAGYQSGQPFPHAVIDDFLPPELLEACLSHFPSKLDPDGMVFDRAQERLKSSFNPDYLDGAARKLFYSLNSRPFLVFLENLSGIKGLIPDPYFLGGGFHEIKNGGHLSVHADFNHHKPMNLERRINVLIYLNKDWKDEYGGQLELWDNAMKACVHSIVPIFNRCVVFNTTSNSNHGNPRVVSHPQGVPRRSIAMYYYTSTWSDEKRDHTTQFKVRPASTDGKDLSTRVDETAREILPPVVYRGLRRVYNRLSR